jgi:hypothetical protein
MSAPLSQRIDLARRINRLEYLEYANVGWLKAVPFEELALRLNEEKDVRLLRNYRRKEGDRGALRGEMIRLFLDWLMWNVPESIGVWGTSPETFRPADRKPAVDVISTIIATSEEALSETAHDFGPDDQDVMVDYEQLRRWFPDRLLDSAGTVFFVCTPPSEMIVLGMDDDIIGMLWQ